MSFFAGGTIRGGFVVGLAAAFAAAFALEWFWVVAFGAAVVAVGAGFAAPGAVVVGGAAAGASLGFGELKEAALVLVDEVFEGGSFVGGQAAFSVLMRVWVASAMQ